MYELDNIYSQNIVSTVELSSRPASGVTVTYDYAYPIQIRWKDGEVVSNSVVSGPASSSPTQTAVSTASHKSSSALSTGAIAAIAVVLGLLTVIGLGFVVLWIRKRRRLMTKPPRPASSETDTPVTVLHEVSGSKSVTSELGSTSVAILPELTGHGIRPAAELDGSQAPRYHR